MRHSSRLHVTLAAAAATMLLCACSGGSSGYTVPVARDAATSSIARVAPASDGRYGAATGTPVVQLKCTTGAPLHGPCAEYTSIPAIGGYGGTIALPAGSGSFTLASSIADRTYIPLLGATPLVYITFTAKTAVILNGLPGFTFSLPASVTGVLNVAEHGSSPWTKIEGPTLVAKAQAAFSPAPGAITLAAGQSASFALYAGVVVPAPSPSPSPTRSSAPVPGVSPVPTLPTSLSGMVTEYSSGAPLAGVAVTVGTYPSATCLANQTATVNACGQPGAVIATTTTTSTGTFTMNVPVGGYMLVVGKGSTYATLHRSVALASGSNAVGTLKIAALTADEQAWLVDLNTLRAVTALPVSYANLVVDEYAEEQARAEAVAVAAGTFPYGDSTEAAFSALYFKAPGALYGASGVSDLQPAASAYLAVDRAYFAEKANCPGGNWQTCTFAQNTGHYINLASTSVLWVGLGESATSHLFPPYGNLYAYAGFQVVGYGQSVPASLRRFVSFPIH